MESTQDRIGELADQISRAVAMNCLTSDGQMCRLDYSALNEIAALLRSMRPIPVNERLPEEGECFAYAPYVWEHAQFGDGCFYLLHFPGKKLDGVTHWLPAPPAP